MYTGKNAQNLNGSSENWKSELKLGHNHVSIELLSELTSINQFCFLKPTLYRKPVDRLWIALSSTNVRGSTSRIPSIDRSAFTIAFVLLCLPSVFFVLEICEILISLDLCCDRYPQLDKMQLTIRRFFEAVVLLEQVLQPLQPVFHANQVQPSNVSSNMPSRFSLPIFGPKHCLQCLQVQVQVHVQVQVQPSNMWIKALLAIPNR